jgi:hypothetical protein
MNRGRVGEERGGKEMDRCPLTITMSTGMFSSRIHPSLLKFLWL